MWLVAGFAWVWSFYFVECLVWLLGCFKLFVRFEFGVMIVVVVGTAFVFDFVCLVC